MKRNLLLFTAIVSVLMPSCDFLEENNPFTRKSREQALQMQIESTRKADSLVNVITEAKRIAAQDSVAAIESLKAYEDSFKYYIIVGSFITPEYAQAHSDYYAGKGFETKIIDKSNSRFRLVSARSCSSMDEAWKELKGYRDTVEFGAWIYVKE